MTDTSLGPWLWLEAFIPADETNEISDFIMKARSYYVQYHTLKGFAYNSFPEVNWWNRLAPRFDAWAGPSCRVWKIDPHDMTRPSQLMVDQDAPYKDYKDRRHLDVRDVLPSTDNGGKPTWFVVYKPSETEWWVCMAGETEEKAPVP